MIEGRTGMCPTGCGATEEAVHYIFCKSKEVIKRREIHHSIFIKQLKAINTYPGIIAMFTKALKYGWEGEWMTNVESDTLIGIQLAEAVQEQSLLTKERFVQGFVTAHWRNVQDLWEQSTNTQKVNDWGKEILTALHSFTIEIWKEQNEVEHGITKEEMLKKRRQGAVKKMALLYKRSRKKLTNKEKEHFQMPQMIRRKQSVETIEFL